MEKHGCKPGEFLKDGKCMNINEVCKRILRRPFMIHADQKIALWPVPQNDGSWTMGKVWQNEPGYEKWENWRFRNEEDATRVCDTFNNILGLTENEVFEIVGSSMKAGNKKGKLYDK